MQDQTLTPPSARVGIFLKAHIFFLTKQPSLNTKPMNLLIHPWPIHVTKKYVVSKNVRIGVDSGAVNQYLKDLVTVPLICWQSSALIYLQQKEIYHLHSRNLLKITATNNITRSAYHDKGSSNLRVCPISQQNRQLFLSSYMTVLQSLFSLK